MQQLQSVAFIEEKKCRLTRQWPFPSQIVVTKGPSVPARYEKLLLLPGMSQTQKMKPAECGFA
jgi:hypothetical protein